MLTTVYQLDAQADFRRFVGTRLLEFIELAPRPLEWIIRIGKVLHLTGEVARAYAAVRPAPASSYPSGDWETARLTRSMHEWTTTETHDERDPNLRAPQRLSNRANIKSTGKKTPRPSYDPFNKPAYASTWHATNRQRQIASETFDVLWEVTRGKLGVESTNTQALRASYDAAKKSQAKDWEEHVGLPEEIFIGEVFGESERTRFADLDEKRQALQAKYARLIQRTQFMTHEERLKEARKERDFTVDVESYNKVTANRKIVEIVAGGIEMKANTLLKQMVRADIRTEQALHDARAEAEGVNTVFTRVVNQMPQDEVHTTVCPGGVFVIVVLNNRPELKRLASLDATEDECEVAFEKLQRESVRNAEKHVKKIARSTGIGKRETARLVAESRERIERAYEDVRTFYRQAACPVHLSEVKLAASVS